MFYGIRISSSFESLRHYFVLQTNPGEQFFMFTSLSSWLIRKAGVQMEQPQEFDDPYTTISNILDRLRKFGVTIDFAPSKLKQGFGEQVKDSKILIIQVHKNYKIVHTFLAMVPKVKGSLTIPAALKDGLTCTLFPQADSFGLFSTISGRRRTMLSLARRQVNIQSAMV